MHIDPNLLISVFVIHLFQPVPFHLSLFSILPPNNLFYIYSYYRIFLHSLNIFLFIKKKIYSALHIRVFLNILLLWGFAYLGRVFLWVQSLLGALRSRLCIEVIFVQSAGAVKYSDCFSAEEQDLDMTLNNLRGWL